MSGAQQQQQSGLTVRPDALTIFEGFEGLNTEPSRYGVPDKQAYIMDGFFPAGPSFARTIPDCSAAITIPGLSAAIVWIWFGNISSTEYGLIFPSDGSIWQINTSTLSSSQIAPPNTIVNPAVGGIGASQWGSAFILIVAAAQTNGYFIWDGTTFYTPGMAVPGFSTVPTGIQGASIETFQSHVWITTGSTLVWSAPGSITDFATGDGGGSLGSTDSTLRVFWYKLKQSNGYLFLWGDSSIFYLAGVTTTGTPPVTSFSIQNVDPEVGTIWPDTVQSLGSNLIFANIWGVHVSFGGRTAKVSTELDGVYNTAVTSSSPRFSSTKAVIFGKRVFVLLLNVIDQVTQQNVNKLFIWTEKRWCSASQNANLIFVSCQEVNSQLIPWGHDGRALYRLFNTPSTNVTKTLQSRFWSPGSYAWEKTESRLWALYQQFSDGQDTVTISVDSEKGSSPVAIPILPDDFVWLNNVGAVVSWTNNASAPFVWPSGTSGNIDAIRPQNCAQNGRLVGFTISTTASNLAIISVATMPVDAGYTG